MATHGVQENPVGKEATVFIQVGDIHFKTDKTAHQAALDDAKRELIRDLTRIIPQLPSVVGVLVCGDIAYSGTEAEYKAARAWLKEVCKTAKCGEETVRTVPGNHDVDRTGWSHNHTLGHVQAALRKRNLQDIDIALHQFTIEDKTSAGLLLAPFKNYNEFALPYFCSITPEKLYWEHIVTLNDGSRLKIRGINSSLASNQLDNDTDNRLVVGTIQATFTQEDGVEYLSMCHHPPTWLLERDEIEDRIRNRVRIQVFGHKHRQRLERINDAVRISAGAVFPSEREPNWVPRYNLIAVEITKQATDRNMIVTVLPRVWNTDGRSFAPEADENGNPWRSWTFKLEPWEPPPQESTHTKPESGPPPTKTSPKELQVVRQMDPLKRLAYRFLSLSFEKRLLVAQRLDLLEPEDRDADETERGRRFFKRANERNQLGKLWEAVEEQHDEPDRTGNPFEEKKQ